MVSIDSTIFTFIPYVAIFSSLPTTTQSALPTIATVLLNKQQKIIQNYFFLINIHIVHIPLLYCRKNWSKSRISRTRRKEIIPANSSSKRNKKQKVITLYTESVYNWKVYSISRFFLNFSLSVCLSIIFLSSVRTDVINWLIKKFKKICTIVENWLPWCKNATNLYVWCAITPSPAKPYYLFVFFKSFRLSR